MEIITNKNGIKYNSESGDCLCGYKDCNKNSVALYINLENNKKLYLCEEHEHDIDKKAFRLAERLD